MAIEVSGLAPEDFAFLTEMLSRDADTVLDEGKQYLVEARLGPVARRFDLADPTAVIAALRGCDPDLAMAVTDAMTLNETSFFRDGAVWTGLKDHLLPQLIEARSRLRRLDFWCAAGSSGQEAYSLAILLAELLGAELASWHIQIVTTDISTEMVTRTAAGRYREDELGRSMNADRRAKFLRRIGPDWEVADHLRKLVLPRQMNLTASTWSVPARFDLVLIRNVLISFPADIRSTILERVARRVADDGRVILGTSEDALGLPATYEPHRFGGLVAYQPNQPAGVLVPALAGAPAVAQDGPSRDLDPLERLRAVRKELNRDLDPRR